MNTPSSFIHVGNFGNAFSVTAAVKAGGQENTNDFSSQARSDDTAAHGQNVGVVVATAEFCRKGIVAERCPDAVNLIGSNADTDAGAAKEDAPVKSTVGNRFRYFLATSG